MDLKTEERMWWMVLIDAEYKLEHSASTSSEDYKIITKYSNISNTARLKLRDNFNINLDDIAILARDKLNELFKEEEKKEELEKQQMDMLDASLALIEKLEGKYKNK